VAPGLYPGAFTFVKTTPAATAKTEAITVNQYVVCMCSRL